MTLPSNGGGKEFNAANNNTRYKVRLPNRLILKEQDWEVALVSLSFPIRDHHKHYMLSSFPRGNRTNVLGEAKVDAVMAEGQQYYEPTHLRYVPLRERELDVIEIILDDLNGSIVDLGIGITSVVLHFKRRGDIKSGWVCKKEKKCTYRFVNDLDVVEGYEVHLDNVAGIFYGCRVASDRIKGYDVHVVPNV